MKDNKRGFLLQTVKQMNNGAIVSGIGFLLYVAASALQLEVLADILVIAFGIVAVYVLVSVAEGRKKDKKAVSYNLLWGQTALTILLVGCAVLTIRLRLGLQESLNEKKRTAPLVRSSFYLFAQPIVVAKAGSSSCTRSRLMAHTKHTTWTENVMIQETG